MSSYNVRVGNLWRARRKDDLGRAAFLDHAYDLLTRGSSNETVVDEADNAPSEFGFHSTQLPSYTFLTRFLSRQNERSVHVPICRQRLT